MNRKQSIVMAWIGAGLLLLGFILCCGPSILFSLSEFVPPIRRSERIPFDVAGWNAPQIDDRGYSTGTRLRMIDDLLKRYDFHDWSVQDVQELLGEPDLKYEFYEIGEPCCSNLPYCECQEYRYTIRYDLQGNIYWLIFEVNDQDEVLDYYFRQED